MIKLKESKNANQDNLLAQKNVFRVKEKALTHKDVENVNTIFLDKCWRTVMIILEGKGKV